MTDLLIAPIATDRNEWLDWRRHGIGGSDIAAILGISPYASPFSLWCDKVGLLDDQDQSEVMEFGHWAELMIGPWFEDRTGLHVSAEQLQVMAAGDPLCRATVDGFVFEHLPQFGPDGSVDRSGNLGGLEIKALGPGKAWAVDLMAGSHRGVSKSDAIPGHFQAQTQWQMHCAGLERVFLAVLMGRRLDLLVIERDQADIDFMVERAHQFWDDHVVTGTPPAVDGHDATADALAQLHPDHTPGMTVEIDAELIEHWRYTKTREKGAIADRKKAAALIQQVIGDAEEAVIDGHREASWRTQGRAGFDHKALLADIGDFVDEGLIPADLIDPKSYETNTTFRVLRDHAPKEK